MKAARVISAVLVLFLVGALLSGCAASPATGGKSAPTGTSVAKDGKLTYGLTLVVSGIDPHQAASSELGIFLTSVYDPLVWQTPDGEFVPGLAKRWEVSEDGRAYTFYLRDDVTFHDGTPLDAEAVKFSLDRIADPALKSQKAVNMLGPYDHTEIVDEHAARVYFSEPYAPFLDSLSQVYLAIVSPTAVHKWGEEYRDHQVGTGPFIMQEYVAKDHITLARNPDYNWAPEFMEHQGPAYLDEITFRFYPDAATRAPALQAGEVDVMGEVPPLDAARLESTGLFSLLPVKVPGQSLQIFLNSKRFPTDDLRVRRAILYAVDRPAIVKAVFGVYSPVAWGPLSANTPCYAAAVQGTYAHDAEKARQLLAEAGFSDANGDGILEKDGKPAELELLLMSWGNMPEVGQMVQAMLRDAGLDAKTQMLSYPAAIQAAGEGQHNMIPMALSASDPDILRTFFHSKNVGGGFNWAMWDDAEMDQWLDEAVRTNDAAQRAAMYAQVQQRVMDEALILPIRDYVNLNVARREVKGLRYALQGWFPWFYDVYLEE